MVRTTVAVILLLAGASIGVSITQGRTAAVQAQEREALPFSVGDTIYLWYESEVTCKVVAVRRDFVRCESNQKNLRWFNLRTLNRIETTLIR